MFVFGTSMTLLGPIPKGLMKAAASEERTQPAWPGRPTSKSTAGSPASCRGHGPAPERLIMSPFKASVMSHARANVLTTRRCLPTDSCPVTTSARPVQGENSQNVWELLPVFQDNRICHCYTPARWLPCWHRSYFVVCMLQWGSVIVLGHF